MIFSGGVEVLWVILQCKFIKFEPPPLRSAHVSKLYKCIRNHQSNHACPGDMKIYFPFPKSYFKMFLFALAINVHISITIMQLCIAFNAIQE